MVKGFDAEGRGPGHLTEAERDKLKRQFRGVFWDKKTSRWRCQLGYQSKKIFLGYFDDASEAARAYDQKLVELRGAGARTNFPITDYLDLMQSTPGKRSAAAALAAAAAAAADEDDGLEDEEAMSQPTNPAAAAAAAAYDSYGMHHHTDYMSSHYLQDAGDAAVGSGDNAAAAAAAAAGYDQSHNSSLSRVIPGLPVIGSADAVGKPVPAAVSAAAAAAMAMHQDVDTTKEDMLAAAAQRAIEVRRSYDGSGYRSLFQQQQQQQQQMNAAVSPHMPAAAAGYPEELTAVNSGTVPTAENDAAAAAAALVYGPTAAAAAGGYHVNHSVMPGSRRRPSYTGQQQQQQQQQSVHGHDWERAAAEAEAAAAAARSGYHVAHRPSSSHIPGYAAAEQQQHVGGYEQGVPYDYQYEHDPRIAGHHVEQQKHPMSGTGGYPGETSYGYHHMHHMAQQQQQQHYGGSSGGGHQRSLHHPYHHHTHHMSHHHGGYDNAQDGTPGDYTAAAPAVGHHRSHHHHHHYVSDLGPPGTYGGTLSHHLMHHHHGSHHMAHHPEHPYTGHHGSQPYGHQIRNPDLEGTRGYYGAAAAANGVYGDGHPDSQYAGHHGSHHGHHGSHPYAGHHGSHPPEQYHHHLQSHSYGRGDQGLPDSAAAAYAQQQQQYGGGLQVQQQQQQQHLHMHGSHAHGEPDVNYDTSMAYRQRLATYGLENYPYAQHQAGSEAYTATATADQQALAQQQTYADQIRSDDLQQQQQQQAAGYGDVAADDAAAAGRDDEYDAEAAWLEKVRARGSGGRHAAAEGRNRRRSAAAAAAVDSDEYDINEDDDHDDDSDTGRGSGRGRARRRSKGTGASGGAAAAAAAAAEGRLRTKQRTGDNAGLPDDERSHSYRGVFWDKKSRRWRCQLGHKNKKIFLGYFGVAEEAARAYDQKLVELHGGSAKTNFPITDYLGGGTLSGMDMTAPAATGSSREYGGASGAAAAAAGHRISWPGGDVQNAWDQQTAAGDADGPAAKRRRVSSDPDGTMRHPSSSSSQQHQQLIMQRSPFEASDGSNAAAAAAAAAASLSGIPNSRSVGDAGVLPVITRAGSGYRLVETPSIGGATNLNSRPAPITAAAAGSSMHDAVAGPFAAAAAGHGSGLPPTGNSGGDRGPSSATTPNVGGGGAFGLSSSSSLGLSRLASGERQAVELLSHLHDGLPARQPVFSSTTGTTGPGSGLGHHGTAGTVTGAVPGPVVTSAAADGTSSVFGSAAVQAFGGGGGPGMGRMGLGVTPAGHQQSQVSRKFEDLVNRYSGSGTAAAAADRAAAGSGGGGGIVPPPIDVSPSPRVAAGRYSSPSPVGAPAITRLDSNEVRAVQSLVGLHNDVLPARNALESPGWGYGSAARAVPPAMHHHHHHHAAHHHQQQQQHYQQQQQHYHHHRQQQQQYSGGALYRPTTNAVLDAAAAPPPAMQQRGSGSGSLGIPSADELIKEVSAVASSTIAAVAAAAAQAKQARGAAAIVGHHHHHQQQQQGGSSLLPPPPPLHLGQLHGHQVSPQVPSEVPPSGSDVTTGPRSHSGTLGDTVNSGLAEVRIPPRTSEAGDQDLLVPNKRPSCSGGSGLMGLLENIGQFKHEADVAAAAAVQEAAPVAAAAAVKEEVRGGHSQIDNSLQQLKEEHADAEQPQTVLKLANAVLLEEQVPITDDQQQQQEQQQGAVTDNLQPAEVLVPSAAPAAAVGTPGDLPQEVLVPMVSTEAAPAANDNFTAAAATAAVAVPSISIPEEASDPAQQSEAEAAVAAAAASVGGEHEHSAPQAAHHFEAVAAAAASALPSEVINPVADATADQSVSALLKPLAAAVPTPAAAAAMPLQLPSMAQAPAAVLPAAAAAAPVAVEQ